MLYWLYREGSVAALLPVPLSAIATSTEKIRCKGGVSVKFCLQKFTDAPFTSNSLHGLAWRLFCLYHVCEGRHECRPRANIIVNHAFWGKLALSE